MLLQLPPCAVKEPVFCDRFVPQRCKNSSKLFEVRQVIERTDLVNYECEDSENSHNTEEKTSKQELRQKMYYCAMLQTVLLEVKDPHTMPGNEVELCTDLSPGHQNKIDCLRLKLEKKPSADDDLESSNLFRPKTESDFFQEPFPEHRSYPTQPVKVLDAPCFSDDYYYNIMDWSSRNCIGIALKNTAYIYNHQASSVTKLFSISNGLEVSHLTFNKEGTLVSAGLTNGMVEIWDVEKQRVLRRMDGHTSRTCAASWSSRLLSTGGKDSLILHRDLRMS